MGKRKVFIKTEISLPQAKQDLTETDKLSILSGTIRPSSTVVRFGMNASSKRSFDFSPWYGVGIDRITYACQRQIERFLAGQDSVITVVTVAHYTDGLRRFLDYCVLQAAAYERELNLIEVDRKLIDGFVHFLTQGRMSNFAKDLYTQTKSVLLALGKRQIISLVVSGDDATFPRNPFPNSFRKAKSETALSKSERQKFSAALRLAIKPIWIDGTTITADLLVYALLVVALHTGRNNTPLLEMGRDCLRPHPKKDTVFLVLWKRRGYSSSKVALRVESKSERELESMPVVRTNVERLIRRVMTLTEPLDSEAPDIVKGRVWLFRSRTIRSLGQVRALQGRQLDLGIKRLVAEHDLKDSNGRPLRINISRLRKTFANRVFELSDGNLATTAAALGNTPRVADHNYLAPSEHTRKNWRFMGEVLVQELLSATVGASYKETPMGRCADTVHGQFAPKREGATCMNFMNCLRCKHYAVTAEDLHKLFSFYFRVLSERSRMDKKRWAREYAYIPRLIDHYIIAEGVRRGTLKAAEVEAARERARTHPHTFWSVDLIDNLEVFS